MINKIIASVGIVGVVTVGAFFSNKTDVPAMSAPVQYATEEPELQIIRESAGEIYEYPSIEDMEIIEDIPQDSVVHYLLFQETPNGDVYTIK